MKLEASSDVVLRLERPHPSLLGEIRDDLRETRQILETPMSRTASSIPLPPDPHV